MLVEIRALKEIRHSGKHYKPYAIIPEIDSESAERLIDLKAAEYTETNHKTTDNANNKPETDGDGVPPVQGNSNPDKKTASSYAEMSNTEQIQYLTSLSDDEFKKAYEELVNCSKSKSKAYADRRLKTLTKENKDTD